VALNPLIDKERPQLLICDGHASHNNVEFLKLAREQDIIIGELPSHTSHWTQPFDRAMSLKSNWNTQVDSFVKETGVPLRKVSRNQSWPIPSFVHPESLTENLAPESDEFGSRHISVSKPCN
jgi:hypothetical protein